MYDAKDFKIIIRGAGDIATGSIARLFNAGFRPIVLDIAKPSAIRRTVAFCDAVYEGSTTIEGITARLAENLDDAIRIAVNNEVPILIDEEASSIDAYRPDAVVDAILAKRNLGTTQDMAPLTIALGPGFEAGKECDFVIETMRGHNLGRIIDKGSAMPNTGVPGLIAGEGKDRVIHAPASGIIKNVNEIGDAVEKGDAIAFIYTNESSGAESYKNEAENESSETESESSGTESKKSEAESENTEIKNDGTEKDKGDKTTCVPVPASISGLLRGIIRDGYEVEEGLKIADIDPRLEEHDNCFTISDKAYAIGGSVLQLVTAALVSN